MGDVGIDVGVPMLTEVIPQLHVAAILLETHAGTVVVGSSILGRDRAAEPAAAYLIGSLCLDSSITSCPKIDGGFHVVAICRGCTCDNVEHTAHGIASVEN